MRPVQCLIAGLCLCACAPHREKSVSRTYPNAGEPAETRLVVQTVKVNPDTFPGATLSLAKPLPAGSEVRIRFVTGTDRWRYGPEGTTSRPAPSNYVLPGGPKECLCVRVGDEAWQSAAHRRASWASIRTKTAADRIEFARNTAVNMPTEKGQPTMTFVVELHPPR